MMDSEANIGATKMQQPEELTMKQIDELREAFELFDHDGNGCITSSELLTVMHRLRQQVSEQEIKEMIHQVDIDDETPITFKQFVTLVLRIRCQDNLVDSLHDVFKACDEDQDGLVSANDIYWTLCIMGYTVTPPEVKKMVADITRSEEGQLNKNEFLNMMLSKFTLSLTPRDMDSLTPCQLRDLFLGFHLIDRGKTGLIGRADGVTVLTSLGHNFSQEVLENAFSEACSSDTDTLTYTDFLQLLDQCIRFRGEDAEMTAMFQAFDTDGNGYIDADELSSTMCKLGMALTEDDVANMMKEIGAYDSGKIYYKDFLKLMSGKLKRSTKMAAETEIDDMCTNIATKTHADSPETEELRLSFSIFDKNGDGHIERSEVLEVMASMGITVDEQEVADMIHSADKDGNGMIEFDEFCELMGKSRHLLPLRHSELVRQDSGQSRASSGGYLTPDWASSNPDLLSGDDDDDLRDKFQLFDKDGDGFVTEKDIRETMKSLGMTLTNKDIKAMMKVAGKDVHGKISFKGFAKMICGQFVNPEVITQKQLSKSQTKELKVLFSLFDKNGDGFISMDEVRSVLGTLQLPCDENNLQTSFKQYDLDGNGQIDFNEFIRMMEKNIIGQQKSSTRRGRSYSSASKHSEIQAMFTAFDKDNSGYIDAKELKNTMKELGINLSSKDLKDMLKEAGGHGRIYYEDFLKIMTNDGGPESKKFALLDDQSTLAPSTTDRSRASSGNSLTLPDYVPLNVTDLQVSFALFDKNKDGSISCAEVLGVMHSMGLKVNEEKVKKMIDKVDTDGNGLIDFEEFHRMMMMYHRQRSSRSRSVSGTSTASSMSVEDEDMQQLFYIFDKDRDGFINAEDIRDTMKELGVVLTHDDVVAMMSQAGVGPKGKLYYKDFCKVMHGQFRTPVDQKGETLSQEQVKDLQTLFCLFDMNKDGFISLDEVIQASKMLGICTKDPASVKSMFDQVDLDGNGMIDFNEFTHLVQNHVLLPRGLVSAEPDQAVPPQPEDDPELMAMFRAFDEDGNGFIDATELQNTMSKLGIKVKNTDIEEMLKEANAEDGKIFYEDFVKFMNGEVGQKQKTASTLFSDLPPSPLVNRREEWIVSSSNSHDPVNIQDLRVTFTLFDLDNDGLVGSQEVVEMLWSHDLNHIPSQSIINTVHTIDTTGTGQLNFGQFCDVFKSFHQIPYQPPPSPRSATGRSPKLLPKSSPRIAQRNGTKSKDTRTHKGHSTSSDHDSSSTKMGIPHIIVSKCRDILPKIPKFSGKRDKTGTSVWPSKSNKGSAKESKEKKDRQTVSKGTDSTDGSTSTQQQNGKPRIAQDVRSKHSRTSSPSLTSRSPSTSPSVSKKKTNTIHQTEKVHQAEVVSGAPFVHPLSLSPKTHSKHHDHTGYSPHGQPSSAKPPSTQSQTCDTHDISVSISLKDTTVQADVRQKVPQTNTTGMTGVSSTRRAHSNTSSPRHNSSSSHSSSTDTPDIPKSWTAFKMFDKNSNGYIDATELDLAMREMGVVLSPEQLITLLENADLNGDGQIDYKEFKRLIHGALRRFENLAVDLYERKQVQTRRATSPNIQPRQSHAAEAGAGAVHLGADVIPSVTTAADTGCGLPVTTERVTEGNGMVDFNEFLGMMAHSKSRHTEGCHEDAEENEMRQAFKVFDIDGNGLIDAQELRLTMRNLGETLSEQDVKAMIKAADRNGDGKIDYEEFIKMMYNK